MGRFRRACRRSEVEHIVHRSRIEVLSEWLADVPFFKAESWLMPKMGQILKVARGEIVNTKHVVPFAQKAVSQM